MNLGSWVWPQSRAALRELEAEDLEKELTVLGWALVFLVLALVAAAFGFQGVAGTASGMARMLFFLFLVLFVLSVLF
jgi:uncharacterized membrane protein YtjA (UPF0391 family)